MRMAQCAHLQNDDVWGKKKRKKKKKDVETIVAVV